MSQVQNPPEWDVAENLGAVLKAQFPIKSTARGWPDRAWLLVDGNLPAVRFLFISEKSAPSQAARQAVAGTILTGGGAGYILREARRLHLLMQVSLFCNTPAQRDTLGFQIEQYLIANDYLQMLDYTLATPAPVATGEHIMLYYRSTAPDPQGEQNFYRRDMTWAVQARVLDATPGQQVTTINATATTYFGKQSSTDNY